MKGLVSATRPILRVLCIDMYQDDNNYCSQKKGLYQFITVQKESGFNTKFLTYSVTKVWNNAEKSEQALKIGIKSLLPLNQNVSRECSIDRQIDR